MYQAFYRKYRPKCFSDVYGQDHVVATLKNELKENRISHAYLFTGSRGTGKTSCAKILAKAVNCENPVDGEPCNQCEVCRGIDSGVIYDVVEIDAASNNGVDNIRDLREEANYTPSRGRYRVYIIDEVHMLSTGAFNALLKTLEEPPSHVIFILATTEVHKLPATILSRCQRFDFKRIQPETMALRLKEVANFEGLDITDEAAILIARIADGALRDGLSVLDQCASRGEKIDADLVAEVAGIAGRETLHMLAKAIADKNSADAINIISQLYQNSFDMERLCVELINLFRNYLIVKTVKNSRELIICTDNEYDVLTESAGAMTLESIIFALDLLQTSLTKIKTGANSRIEMELALVRLCEPKLEQSLDSLLERISQLERVVKNSTGLKNDEAANPQKEHSQHIAVSEPDLNKDEKVSALHSEHNESRDSAKPNLNDTEETQGTKASPTAAGSEDVKPVREQVELYQSFEQWQDFLNIIHKNDIALFGVLSSASAHIQNEYFVIDSSNPTIKEFIRIPTHFKAIKQAVLEMTGRAYKIAVCKPKTQSGQKSDLLEDLINKAQNNVKINFE